MVHDGARAITLLYPTQADPVGLAPAAPRAVVAAPRSRMNPAEGVATEILLLLVTPESLSITGLSDELWVATPAQPERLEELRGFLERLSRTTYDSTVAYPRVLE